MPPNGDIKQVPSADITSPRVSRRLIKRRKVFRLAGGLIADAFSEETSNGSGGYHARARRLGTAGSDPIPFRSFAAYFHICKNGITTLVYLQEKHGLFLH